MTFVFSGFLGGFSGATASQCIVFALFFVGRLTNVRFLGRFGGFRRPFFGCFQVAYFGLYIALNDALQACFAIRSYYILVG